MEALIHHFKLVTEGFPACRRATNLLPIESRAASSAASLRSDGLPPSPRACTCATRASSTSRRPRRLHGRGATSPRSRDAGDARPILGGIDREPRSAATSTARASRVGRGWSTSAKDPAGIPVPALSPFPDACAPRSRSGWRAVPDRHSAALPALGPRSASTGGVARGDRPGGLRDAPDAGYLTSVATLYDMFELAPTGATRSDRLTNISCSCAALTRALPRRRGGGRGRRRHQPAPLRVPGRLRHRADGLPVDQRYYGPLEIADASRLLDDLRAGREPLPELALALRPRRPASRSAE